MGLVIIVVFCIIGIVIILQRKGLGNQGGNGYPNDDYPRSHYNGSSIDSGSVSSNNSADYSPSNTGDGGEVIYCERITDDSRSGDDRSDNNSGGDCFESTGNDSGGGDCSSDNS